MNIKLLEKLFLNEEKKVSWVKLGLAIVSIAGVTLTVPAPFWILLICKYICAVGTIVFGAGCRDIVGKLTTQNKD
jgi:uncharacterized membrane protein